MSETGHAKNVANFETVILALEPLGASYNPTQPLIALAALQSRLAAVKAAVNAVNATATTATLAVDDRENAFADIGIFSNAVGKAAAVAVNDAAFNEDMQTLTRLISGRRAKSKPAANPENPENPENPAAAEPPAAHSVSHRSYDNLEANFGKVIELLQARDDYAPNEDEFKTDALEAKQAAMQTANTAAKTASIAADNSRAARDALLYDEETGILALVALIKKYLDYAFGKSSAVYQQISALKFKKMK